MHLARPVFVFHCVIPKISVIMAFAAYIQFLLENNVFHTVTKTSHMYVSLLWNYLLWERRAVDTGSHINEAAQNEKAEKTKKNSYSVGPRKDWRSGEYLLQGKTKW